MKVVAEVTKEQKDFLDLIVHTDAANSIGGAKGELGNAVQWCIDACMKIEERYGIDACYVGHYDIRLPEHDPSESCKSVLIIKTTVDNLSSALDQSSLQQSPEYLPACICHNVGGRLYHNKDCAVHNIKNPIEQSPEVGEDDIEKIAEGLWARHSLSSEHLPDHDELMDKADFTAALKEFNQKSEK
jgi:hypothetical protein